MSAGNDSLDPPQADSRLSKWGWLLLFVPLWGVGELQAHFVQTSRAIAEADLAHVRSEVGPLGPDDVVAFAPRWLDPAGRAAFADALGGDLTRTSPADYARFSRAFEVAIGGAGEPDLAGWPVEWEKSIGKLTLRLRQNKSWSTIQDRLFTRVGSDKMSVSQGEHECALSRGAPNAGAWDVPTPGVRYNCPGGAVGMVVVPGLDFRLRHCLLVPAGGTPTRIRLRDVVFGTSLRFAHGLHVVHERDRNGPPIDVRVFVQTDTPGGGTHDVDLGRAVHTDGDGFTSFDIATPLAGQVGDLFVEVSSSGNKRAYCMEGFAR